MPETTPTPTHATAGCPFGHGARPQAVAAAPHEGRLVAEPAEPEDPAPALGRCLTRWARASTTPPPSRAWTWTRLSKTCMP
jgi:hypothetical protein